MGITLGVPCEATAPFNYTELTPVTYCTLNPHIFLEFGFNKGIPIGRVEIELIRSASPSLVENLVKLVRGDFKDCVTGKHVRLHGSLIHVINSLNGVIMTGDVQYGNGCGGRAANSEGIVNDEGGTTIPIKGFCVVMLPQPSDSSLFSSIFYIIASDRPSPVVDGKVIGYVTQGHQFLRDFTDEYGSLNGIPKRQIFIQECGQI